MTRSLEPRELFQKLLANIEQVIHGQTDVLRKVLAAAELARPGLDSEFYLIEGTGLSDSEWTGAKAKRSLPGLRDSVESGQWSRRGCCLC